MTPAHAYLLHPVRTRGLTNQQAVTCLPSLSQDLRRRRQETTSVTMAREVSSHESSCLANCRLLHVSIHCCIVFVQSGSTLTGAHKDCLFLASFAQQPEIQTKKILDRDLSKTRKLGVNDRLSDTSIIRENGNSYDRRTCARM